MTENEDAFELVVWGATGFTGRLVAREACAVKGLRWAIGGRSQAKLEALRAELGRPELPILIGDSFDRASLDAICARTKVVVSTVGPYAAFGSELVAACAESGTHYGDLTGEPHWIRRMIDAHHERAVETGARLVHCCGFDSIPSDLGCWVLQQAARERHGAPCEEVDLVVLGMRGGFSGGTAASMLQAVKEVRSDPATRRLIGDPYALNPRDAQGGPDRNERLRPRRDPRHGWLAPFVMAGINTRVVRRTNALLGFPYGREFRYSESMRTGRGLKGAAAALGVSAGMAGFMAGAALGPTRAVLKRFLPDPGEGPGETEREEGFFKLQLDGRGRSASGEPFEVSVTVAGQRDPGYGATSRMLLASALTLARDELEAGGGSWTPAACMAAPLRERLRAAEVTFTLAD